MKVRILATVGFLFLAAMILWPSKKLDDGTRVEKYQALWIQDFAKLKEENLLPKGWDSIGQIEMKPMGKSASDLVPHLKAPVSTVPDGKYILEVELDVLEGDSGGLVLFHHLVDGKSGNTIWELGRTYTVR